MLLICTYFSFANATNVKLHAQATRSPGYYWIVILNQFNIREQSTTSPVKDKIMLLCLFLCFVHYFNVEFLCNNYIMAYQQVRHA